jgi:hypothetical protein
MTAFRSLCLFLPAVAAWVACSASTLDLDSSDDGVCRYVLDAWLHAEGGAVPLGGIRSYQCVKEVEYDNGAPGTTVRIVETGAGHVRMESSSPGTGTLIQAYDGRMGWRSHGQWGLGPMSKEDVQSLISQAELSTATALIREYPLRTLLPGEEVEGRPCYVLGMTGGEAVEEKWFFDKETRELIRIERPVKGGANPIEIYFSDFATTGGFTSARKTRLVMGKWGMTIRRTDLEINPAVDEASFVLTMDQLREINAVAAILARHASVYGDPERNSSRFRSRIIHTVVDSSASGLTSQVAIFLRAPEFVHYQVDIPGMGRTVEVYDGHSGWMDSDILGFHRLKPAEIDKLESEVNSYLLPNLARSFPLRRLVGERIVNGRHAIAVELATLAGPDGTYYFDKETGRLLRLVPPRNRDSMGTVIDFSDFRVIDGIEIPFVTTLNNFAGKTVGRLQSIETDVPLADDLFGPPPAGR